MHQTGDYVNNDVMNTSTTEPDVASSAVNGSEPAETTLQYSTDMENGKNLDTCTAGRRKKAQPVRLNKDGEENPQDSNDSPPPLQMDYEDSDSATEDFEPPVPLAALQENNAAHFNGSDIPPQLTDQSSDVALKSAEQTNSTLRDIIISTKPLSPQQQQQQQNGLPSARLPLNIPTSEPTSPTSQPNPAAHMPNFSDLSKLPFPLSMMPGMPGFPPGLFPGLPVSESAINSDQNTASVEGSNGGGDQSRANSQNEHIKMEQEEEIAAALGARPCPHCGKHFQRDKHLERHIVEEHSVSTPMTSSHRGYACALCPYTTSHYSNLYVHMRVHTGEKPYFCGACGHRSSQGSTLKMHIKTRHSGNVKDYYNLDGNARIRLAHLGKRPMDGVELMAPILNGRIVTDPKLLDPEQGQLAEAKCGKAANKSNQSNRMTGMGFPAGSVPRVPLPFNGMPALPMMPPGGLPLPQQPAGMPSLPPHLNPFQASLNMVSSTSPVTSKSSDNLASLSPKPEPSTAQERAGETDAAGSAAVSVASAAVTAAAEANFLASGGLPPSATAALSAALLASAPRLPIPWGGGIPPGFPPQAAAAAVAGLMPLMNAQLLQRMPLIPPIANLKQEAKEDEGARKRHESLDSQARSHSSNSSRHEAATTNNQDLHSPCSDSDCTHANDANKVRQDLQKLTEQLHDLSSELEHVRSEKDGSHAALMQLRGNVLRFLRVLMPSLSTSHPGLSASDPRVDKALECILTTLP